jgi:hypothetical protein
MHLFAAALEYRDVFACKLLGQGFGILAFWAILDTKLHECIRHAQKSSYRRPSSNIPSQAAKVGMPPGPIIMSDFIKIKDFTSSSIDGMCNIGVLNLKCVALVC